MEIKDKLIGKMIFKNFKLKKKIGEGSFGKVYMIANSKTGDMFAAKLVRNKIILLIFI